MKKSVVFAFLCVASFSSLGAGCGSTSAPVVPPASSLAGLTPKHISERMKLVNGSVIVLRQGIGGLGGQFAEKVGVRGLGGTRDVVVLQYVPAKNADVSWKFTTRVTPDPKDLKDSGTRQYTGSVQGINLLTSHKMYLPGYWVEGDRNAFDASAIWLSQDVFDDLSKNRRSTLDFGLLDPALISMLPREKDIARMLETLKLNLDSIGMKKDVRFIEADSMPIEWPLKINGQEVRVQALKARNWFGEIVILDTKQNPLVLKVTLNPLLLASLGRGSGVDFLKTVGYEITELKDIHQ